VGEGTILADVLVTILVHSREVPSRYPDQSPERVLGGDQEIFGLV
jgi:hypothetical protein